MAQGNQRWSFRLELSSPPTLIPQASNASIASSMQMTNAIGTAHTHPDVPNDNDLEEGEIREDEDMWDSEDEDFTPDDSSMDDDSDNQLSDEKMEELEEAELKEVTDDAAADIARVREKEEGRPMSELMYVLPYPNRDMEQIRRYVLRGGETWCEIYFQGSEVEEDLYRLIHISSSEIDLKSLPVRADAEGLQYIINETDPTAGQRKMYYHGGYHTGCALFHHKTTYRFPALDLLQPGEGMVALRYTITQERYHPGPPPENPQEHAFFTISEISPDSSHRVPAGDMVSIIDVIEWLSHMPGTTELAFVTTLRNDELIFRVRLTSRFPRRPFYKEYNFEFTKAEWDVIPALSRNNAEAMEDAAVAMQFRATEHQWYLDHLKSLGWGGGEPWMEGIEEARQFNFVEWHYNCTELYELSTARAWHEVSYQLSKKGLSLPNFDWKERTLRIPVSELLMKKVEVIHPSELSPDQTACHICTTDFAQLQEFPAKFHCRCGGVYGLGCLLEWYRDIRGGTIKTCPSCRDAIYQKNEVVSDLYPLYQEGDPAEWARNNLDLDFGLDPVSTTWNESLLRLSYEYVYLMTAGPLESEGRSPEARYHPHLSMQSGMARLAWCKVVKQYAGKQAQPKDLLASFENHLRSRRPPLQGYAAQMYSRDPKHWEFFGDVDAPWPYWMRVAHRSLKFYMLRGISPSADTPGTNELDGDFCIRTLKSDDIVKGGTVHRLFFNRDRWSNSSAEDEAQNAWGQWWDDWTAKRIIDPTDIWEEAMQ